MTTLPLSDKARLARRKPRALDALARRAVLSSLETLGVGSLTIRDADEAHSFGADNADLHAEIRILNPRAWSAVAFGGSMGAGESYSEGWWTCSDVAALTEIMLRNRSALERVDSRWRTVTPLVQRVLSFLERNTRAGARRNIAAHYDLSNDFFALFLDPTLTYSCAVFENGAGTLEAASREKLDRACRKLNLRTGHRVLEIGTGWGSMALHAASTRRCRVHTTTISRRQAELARTRVADAGLADRVTIFEKDFRDLIGQYDRLVSIEMAEAIGRDLLPAYFQTISNRLKPDGLACIQAITIRDQFDRRAVKTRDWLKKHIFPGSCLLSVEAISRAAARTDLRIVHLEDIGHHYVRTLRHWRDTFHDRLDDVRALGFDDHFIRAWEYYLAHCEGAFAARHTGDVQIVLAKPEARWTGPDPVGGA